MKDHIGCSLPSVTMATSITSHTCEHTVIAMVTYPTMRCSTWSGKGRRPGAANVTSARQGPSWWLDWDRAAENLDNAADTPTDRQQSCDIHVTQQSCDIHVTSQAPTPVFFLPYCSGDLAEGSFDIPQQHISHG